MEHIFAQLLEEAPQGLPQVDLGQSTLVSVLNLAFGILGGISLVIISLQGLRYSLSGGDPGKTKQAKDGILYALIGIVVAIMGASLTQFVLGYLLDDTTGAVTLTGEANLFVRVASLIAFGTGVASVIMMIIGGIKYNLSAGDPSKVSSAKNTIIYALVGVVVTAVAAPLILFVANQV